MSKTNVWSKRRWLGKQADWDDTYIAASVGARHGRLTLSDGTDTVTILLNRKGDMRMLDGIIETIQEFRVNLVEAEEAK